MVVVESYAVAVEEGLVVEVFGDHGVDETRNQGCVAAWPNGDLLVGHGDGRLGVARVDDDRAHPKLFACLLGDEHLAAAGHACLGRVVAEHYLQLGVLGIVERIACYPRPVEVRVGLGDLGGGVVAVVIEVATPGVHEPGEGTLVWWP